MYLNLGESKFQGRALFLITTIKRYMLTPCFKIFNHFWLMIKIVIFPVAIWTFQAIFTWPGKQIFGMLVWFCPFKRISSLTLEITIAVLEFPDPSNMNFVGVSLPSRKNSQEPPNAGAPMLWWDAHLGHDAEGDIVIETGPESRYHSRPKRLQFGITVLWWFWQNPWRRVGTIRPATSVFLFLVFPVWLFLLLFKNELMTRHIRKLCGQFSDVFPHFSAWTHFLEIFRIVLYFLPTFFPAQLSNLLTNDCREFFRFLRISF